MRGGHLPGEVGVDGVERVDDDDQALAGVEHRPRPWVADVPAEVAGGADGGGGPDLIPPVAQQLTGEQDVEQVGRASRQSSTAC